MKRKVDESTGIQPKIENKRYENHEGAICLQYNFACLNSSHKSLGYCCLEMNLATINRTLIPNSAWYICSRTRDNAQQKVGCESPRLIGKEIFPQKRKFRKRCGNMLIANKLTNKLKGRYKGVPNLARTPQYKDIVIYFTYRVLYYSQMQGDCRHPTCMDLKIKHFLSFRRNVCKTHINSVLKGNVKSVM
jgi:hypothetical protein